MKSCSARVTISETRLKITDDIMGVEVVIKVVQDIFFIEFGKDREY